VSSSVSDSSKSRLDINGSLCLGADYDIKKAPALALVQEINRDNNGSRLLGTKAAHAETDSLLGKRRHETERLSHSEHLGLKLGA
jgi:hypothetical protein